MLQNAKSTRDESAWEIEVRAEIPAEEIARYREKTLKEMRASVQLDGFRKGHAPLERIIHVYGEEAILKRAVEMAIQSELPEFLAQEKILVIEPPRVSIDPPALEKSVSFVARAALAPTIELPDYKAVARGHPMSADTEVSDEEHKEALTHLRRERARIDKVETGVEPQKASEESRAMKEEELPALDDQFVQSLGIESAEKFSETVRVNIKNEKELRAREKRRAAILEDLVQSSKIQYPPKLREYELGDLEGRFKEDIARSGGTWEGFLAESKKTREELRESWKEAADKRAKVRLILSEIARKETIEPDEEEIRKELEHAKKHFPGADSEILRANIAHALRNELTLRFLEGQKR